MASRIVALLCFVQLSHAFLFDQNIPSLSPDSLVYLNSTVGGILGRKSTFSADGKVQQMTIFRGIPYAESPVGKLRFEKPVAKAPFTATYAATEFGPECLQFSTGQSGNFSEDCLSLNVYVPSGTVPTRNRKSVMIWIHGGGFMSGAGSMYDAYKLSVNGDVIVVTMNYRLSQLGFLRINSSYIPGNYGLWDQHLAIKWVHDNIEAFGGNANSVTIFGQSAGAAGVMFQANYPGNSGMFHRAIAESGSSYSTWARVDETRSREATRAFASSLGCDDTDDVMMMQCLRQASTEDIQKTINAFSYHPNDYLFVPSFDGDFVLTEQSGMFDLSTATTKSLSFFSSLDLMVGFNRADGFSSLGGLSTWVGNSTGGIASYTVTEHEFEDIIIPYYIYQYDDYRNVSDMIQSSVAFAYTNWSDPHDVNSRMRSLIKFLTDIDFAVPSLKALNARNVSQKHSYLYEFAFKPTNLMLPGINYISDESMANHGDEILFVFDSMDAQATQEEIRMAKAMSTMWTNFAKTGDPNQPEDIRQYYPITWPQYDQQTQQYLEFSHHMSPQSVKARLNARRMAFWTNLLPALQRDSQSGM